MNPYKELQQLVFNLEEDFTKFYEKGNNAAGIRIRKGMQHLKEWAQETRTHIQDIRNSSKKS